ncbi:MAG: M81 family metallopeptidase [Oscillospiraceae bacterium]|nr:M81 family metallopeptidase [Oscillospiraceae bacterium]
MKKILVLEFHQETNTFNPLISPFQRFQPDCVFEGQARYEQTVKAAGAVAGGVAAIEKAGGTVIPTVFMRASSGGRAADEVFDHLCQRLEEYIKREEFDGIYAALHGATCTQTHDDACGELLAFLRARAGSRVIAASFDLHANITQKVLQNADIICGYNTYPHVDHYETGYRAGKLCMEYLAGNRYAMAAAGVAMLIPPSGYTHLNGPFRQLIEAGKAMVDKGDILDFTVFPVQPWLDIPEIKSRVVTIGKDEEKAKRCAESLAQQLFALRDAAQTPLTDVEDIITAAEENTSGKPVILADPADSPNGGCVGDSPVVAMALASRGSHLRSCMFVVDPEGVEQAFALGVGGSGQFRIGAGFTKGMPGPFCGKGTVRSLHDGYFEPKKNDAKYLGKTAVVQFGTMDILLCCQGAASGSPMIYRSFGMEPSHYDLIVVKANTSFRAPYSTISDLIYVADTPGAGASNLKLMQWERLPKGCYPFDLPEDYVPEKAELY